MDESRRSLRALSQAQPIKKEMDETLFKLEMSKRRYLALEREQNQLKDELEQKKKKLTEMKILQPKIRINSNKASQVGTSVNNVDRNQQIIYSRIQQLRTDIDVARRETIKYKSLNEQLETDNNSALKQCQTIEAKVKQLQENGEQLRQRLVELRELSGKNTQEFKKSHMKGLQSDRKDDTDRKRQLIVQKSFIGEQIKTSRLIHFELLSQVLREKVLVAQHGQGKAEILTGSVELARHRVKGMINTNKEKIRIAESFRRFGENLEQMFTVMKQYKGRQDIEFIAQEFVTKERQLKKLGEYISNLEERIMLSEKTNQQELLRHQEMRAASNVDRVREVDRKYQALNEEITVKISSMEDQQKLRDTWFALIAKILAPVVPEPFSRSTATSNIAFMESKLRSRPEELSSKSPTRQNINPTIEVSEKGSYSELMNYDKMRQFALEYLKAKKAT